MRWVSYVRTVSCMEKEDPPANIISQQNLHIREYMDAHGWRVEKKYVDRKKSKDATEAFDQMMQDGMRRAFDGVVVDSVFRCGRDLWAAREMLERTFYPAGISFAIVEDGFFSGEQTEKTIEKYFEKKRAEYFKLDTGERLRGQLIKGRVIGPMRRYGYVVAKDGSGLIIEEEGAEVIRLIYQLFLEGKCYSKIAEELNQRGIMAPQEQKAKAAGKISNAISTAKWQSNSVKSILTSPVYMGEWARKINGEKVICPVPPIVSKEMFEEAQRRIVKRKKGPREEKWSPNVMYKHIFDKETGELMRCVKSPTETGKRVYAPVRRRRYTDEEKRKMVSESLVVETVRDCINLAARQAAFVDGLLKDGKGLKYMDYEIEPLRAQAKVLFSELNAFCVERMEMHKEHEAGTLEDAVFEKRENEYQENFTKNEEGFKKINSEVETIRKALSRENPWVILFRDAGILDELEHDHIVKYVDRVFVTGPQGVEVILKSSEWMNRLPKEWLDQGMEEN